MDHATLAVLKVTRYKHRGVFMYGEAEGGRRVVRKIIIYHTAASLNLVSLCTLFDLFSGELPVHHLLNRWTRTLSDSLPQSLLTAYTMRINQL